jgi:hypothetical protein
MQAAIDAAALLNKALSFDNTHRYLITAQLNVTAPIDIEGQYTYGVWWGNQITGSGTISCPGGLVTNNTGITMLNVSAVTATVRGLCIEMTTESNVNPTSGAAINLAPPTGDYQAGVHIERNTIIRPYDGITVGGGPDTRCCGANTSADPIFVGWNTIISPADVGISNGKKTYGAATTGTTYWDNAIVCNTTAGKDHAIGFALYDGDIDYNGTTNGPLGCNIGFAFIPGTISGHGQNVGGSFYGVFGDQNTTNDLLIQPSTSLGTVDFIYSSNAWASATSNRTSVLINCATGSCQEISFLGAQFHGGNGQALPIVDIEGGPTGGIYDLSIVGSNICEFGTPGAGSIGLNINLKNAVSGRFVITGNRIGTACPGSGTLATGIALTFSGSAPGGGGANLLIANNDMSRISGAGGTPISYTPNNENVNILNNTGIDDQTGSVFDAGTITLSVNRPTFAITGTGTTVKYLGKSWMTNGIITMITQDGAITFSTGGNICNAVTSAGAQAVVLGRWNVANGCWNLK